MKIEMRSLHLFILLFTVCSLLVHSPSDFEVLAATNSDGTIKSSEEINSSTDNGPTIEDGGPWGNPGDQFGNSVADMGDLNGDGTNDLVVGAWTDDDGCSTQNCGTIHILYMDTDGSLAASTDEFDCSHAKIKCGNNDSFGKSVAPIDLNNDGVNDIAVGAHKDNCSADSGCSGWDDRGVIHILFMDSDENVVSVEEIDARVSNGPSLGNNSFFGTSIANIGDYDGDGVDDLVSGTQKEGPGSSQGAIFIMFMNTNGSLDKTIEINSGTTNGPDLSNGDQFGWSIANIGDLDGNDVNDLAVGARGDDTVHILFMNSCNQCAANAAVSSVVEINSTTLGVTVGGTFGDSVANMGDLDGDGVQDLAIGSRTDTGGGSVRIVYMNTDGTPKSSALIDSTSTDGPTISGGDWFGNAVASIGDLDGNGITDMAVGAEQDDHGGKNRGALHIIFLQETDKPTATITTSSGDCDDTVSLTTLSYTVTFNESTSNFVVGDITVTGTANSSSPEASNFAGSGTTYTFDVIKGSSDGTVLVSVAAGVATDAAGNDNTASDSCTFTIDTVGPTVTITSSTGDSGGTISSGTVRYTITFSSSVTGFTIGDITVTGTANGGSPAASNFAGSGTTYTFDVVRGSSGGTVTVKIAADVATDSDGNDNTISNTYELTVESLAFSGGCSKHTLLGNCGTISINNDVYRIAKNWNNFPATEVLVGDPVTITLSIPKKPTYTKISSASVYTEIFDSPKNYEQSSYIDYSPMNNKITYTSQSQLFQVAGATHRIIQDPDVMNLDRFEVVFTMIFAKPMDTSHIVIETKNSSGFPEIIYLTNALKVSERPIYALTLEEQSKFELTYKPEIESEPDMKREIEPEPKGICGKGTVLKDNMCVPKEWSFFDFFEQLMKLFG